MKYLKTGYFIYFFLLFWCNFLHNHPVLQIQVNFQFIKRLHGFCCGIFRCQSSGRDTDREFTPNCSEIQFTGKSRRKLPILRRNSLREEHDGKTKNKIRILPISKQFLLKNDEKLDMQSQTHTKHYTANYFYSDRRGDVHGGFFLTVKFRQNNPPGQKYKCCRNEKVTSGDLLPKNSCCENFGNF